MGATVNYYSRTQTSRETALCMGAGSPGWGPTHSGSVGVETEDGCGPKTAYGVLLKKLAVIL